MKHLTRVLRGSYFILGYLLIMGLVGSFIMGLIAKPLVFGPVLGLFLIYSIGCLSEKDDVS